MIYGILILWLSLINSEREEEMVDINEYERVVEASQAPLFKYCYFRLGKNRELTEETLDDVFHVLYKKWSTLNLDDNLMGWLYHVADREIKQHLRRHNLYYKRFESLEEALDARQLESLAYTDEYFDKSDIDEEEYFDKIENALPAEYRKIFRYRFIEKHTLVETSAHLGIPYSTLRPRVLKLEEMIREKVAELFER